MAPPRPHLVPTDAPDWTPDPFPLLTDPAPCSGPVLLSDGDGFAASAASVPRTSVALTQTLYLQEPGDTARISVNDLHQGQIGDCFLIASIGEIALTRPTAISGMIQANANGTETVRLYTAANGRLPTPSTTTFRATSITVENTFPTNAVNNGATQNVVNNQKEIWPQVIEKAFAAANGGYAAIAQGGSPVIAMEELTGHTARAISPASLTLAALQADIAAGDLIVMDTRPGNGLPFNLVGSHAYMVERVTSGPGGGMVQLGNPWGTNQPAAIPFAQLTRGIAEIDIGHLA